MRKQLLLLLLLALVLTGCLHYEEKLELNQSGSGNFTFRLGVPEKDSGLLDQLTESIATLDDAEKLNNFPGITVTEAGIKQEGEMQYSEISFEFDNLDSFQNVLLQKEVLAMGEMSFEKESDRLIYKRYLPSLDNFAEAELDMATPLEMLTFFLGDSTWKFQAEFQGEIIKTNGKQKEGTNLVTWSYTFTELLNSDHEMWAEVKY